MLPNFALFLAQRTLHVRKISDGALCVLPACIRAECIYVRGPLLRLDSGLNGRKTKTISKGTDALASADSAVPSMPQQLPVERL